MSQAIFTHRISKGSRYNQIYVPAGSESQFEVGDLVEVRLLEKKSKLYYSKSLHKVGEFKEKLISDVFAFLSSYSEVEQVLFFGSFLTKKTEYNDIDMMIVLERDDEKIEKSISLDLTERFNVRFHLLTIPKNSLVDPLKVSPIARSMLHYFISNKKFAVPEEIRVDYNHIMLELMMPEDLLKDRFDNGKVYYDSLRKLVCIEHFLKGKEIPPDKIDDELILLLDRWRVELLKENTYIEEKFLKEIRRVIKDKIVIIHKLLKNGKKR